MASFSEINGKEISRAVDFLVEIIFSLIPFTLFLFFRPGLFLLRLADPFIPQIRSYTDCKYSVSSNVMNGRIGLSKGCPRHLHVCCPTHALFHF